MIHVQINRNSPTPVFRQIYNQLSALIEQNILKPGDRLPPSRQLAQQTGVNRSTICNAYEELWAMGYLQSRPGSYSIVRKRMKTASFQAHADAGQPDWSSLCSPRAETLYQSMKDFESPAPLFAPDTGDSPPAPSAGLPSPSRIDMARLDLDPRLFPVKDFKRSVSEILAVYGAEYGRDESGKAAYGPGLFGYGNACGFLPLREFIARRMLVHGVACDPRHILITNGAQNGFELILKLLTQPGQTVAVESPTYFCALQILGFHGLHIAHTPITPEGADLNTLENIFRTRRPAFFYTMPNFHNPTGVTTRQEHREKLLTLCESYRVPLVEDGFEEEMKYFGKIPPPLKSMDHKGMAIYLGSFSKVLFPGLRTGWIAAGRECIARLAAIRRFSDLSANLFVQAALYEFCRHNDYDLHVKRMNRIYKKRMQTALRALKKHLPPEVSWREPEGGYLIWLEIPGHNGTENDLIRRCAQNGVLTAGGARFFPVPPPPDPIYLRLSISMLNETEIETGVARLGQSINDFLSHKPQPA